MSDAPVEKPSVGVSILAAVLTLGALPLGILFLVVLTRGGEDVAQLWNEGGWGMYPILLLAMVTTLVSAAGVFLAPRGVPAVMGGALSATVLVMGVASFAYRSAVAGAFDAIQHAAPSDRGLIMRGALGEVASLVLLASALVAGLLVLQGVGLLVSSFATRQAAAKRALQFVGAALTCLGVSHFFTALNAGAERDLYAALAHAPAMDRLTLVVDAFERLGSSRAMGLGPMLAALGAAVGGAVLLRNERRAAAGVLFGVLVPLVGLGGLRALARPSAQAFELATSAGTAPALMLLDATPLDEKAFRLVMLGDALRDDEGAPTTVEQLRDGMGVTTVGVGLEPGVKGEAVLALLKELQRAGTKTVSLVGQKRTEPPKFVPEVWRFLFTERRALDFDLVAATECERCTFATLTGQGLVVDDETWPLVNASFSPVPDETHTVYVKADGLSLEQVLSVGHTVSSKSARPVLVLGE